MLVLSRKKNELIELAIDLSQIDPADLIDGKLHIDLTLVGIIGCRARLGIDAPQSVDIRRGEIADLMRQEAAVPQTLSTIPTGVSA